MFLLLQPSHGHDANTCPICLIFTNVPSPLEAGWGAKAKVKFPGVDLSFERNHKGDKVGDTDEHAQKRQLWGLW